MLRNYRLRFILLLILLAPLLATPVWGAPGPFGKSIPEDGDMAQPLLLTLSWGDSVGAVRYEYCYDTTDGDECEEDEWIPAGTVTLPLSGLTYNTTYYWQVRAIDGEGGMTDADEGDWWSFTTQNPVLTVDKALTNQSTTLIALGTVLTYTITATNTGDMTLSNVIVSDTLLTPTGGTTPCATLAVGVSCTLVGNYTVTQVDVDAGTIVNTGSAVSDEVTVAVTDTVTTSIPQHPALAVDKALTNQSSTPIALGTVLTYTITATNTGDVTLSVVTVSDTLLTSDTEGCPSVGLGGTCVLVGSYTVIQADVDAGQIVNTGSALSEEVTVAVTDTVTTSIPQHPALAVDKALTDQSTTPIALGTVLTYTITATNTGNVTLHNVVVSDPLLTPGMKTCPSVGRGGACVLVGSYTVTQADVDAGQVVNTGSAVSAGVTVAVTDTVITSIPQHPALAVDKALTDRSTTPISLGTVLTYTITATNVGNVTLFNVVVSDPLLTPASEDCGAVALGAICVLTGSYIVQESDFMAGNITNTATATANAPNGDPLDPVTDTVTTALVAAPPVANPDTSLDNPIGQAVTVNVLANDMRGDLPLDPTSVVIVNPPSGSTLILGKLLVVPGQGYWVVDTDTGAITFTPEAGFTGNPTSISYTVDDSRGNTSNAATITIAYTPPPQATDDASLGNAVGSAVTVDVLDNDEAATGRTLEPASVRIVGADAGTGGKVLTVDGEGVWTVDLDTGAITFTPEVGFEGNPLSVAYTVADDQGNISNQAIVTVTYTDNPLTVNDVSLGNLVGSTVTVNVLANDMAAPGRTLNPASVQIVGTANPGASLVVAGEGVWSVNTTTGAITFTPEEGLVGNPAPIAYTVADDQGNLSNAATLTVTYTVPPVANDDASLGNPVGSAVTVDVLDNDVAGDRPLDPASVQIVGTANPGASLVVTGQGVWSVNSTTGEITFTPEASLEGNPTPIAYTVADNQGNVSNTATVTVTYTVSPVANDDASLGNPVGSAVTVDVLDNDEAADLPLDPASVRIVGTGNPGESLVVAGQGVWSVYTTTGAITFTPEASLEGNPTPIAYTVADNQGNVSNTATVTVTYTVPPVAHDDASLGNPVGSAVTVDVLANDVVGDRPLDPASVRIVGTANPGASLVVAGEGVWSVNMTTGEITFTPEAGFEDNPTPITYTVADDQGNISNPATVTVTYTENPLARNDVSSGNPVGSAVTVDVLENDVAAPDRDLDPTSVVIVGAPDDGKELVVADEGTWTVDAVTGVITFTPGVSLVGNPTPIAYTVADDQGNVSNAATVSVMYTEPPVANDDESTGNPVGSAVTVQVLANDTAAEGRVLVPASVVIVGAPDDGKELQTVDEGAWMVDPVTGVITFTPEVDFAGNPTPIAYTVDDDQGNTSNAATVTITYTEIDGRSFVYLPLVIRHWPPIPAVPVLNAIINPNGYGEYTVSWSSSELATSYILQESQNGNFSDAVQVYSDTHTSISLGDRGPTRYYYRVLARNDYGDSGWSNVRSVDVLWEKEPNDDALTQANGPLISGLTYYGRFPSGADKQDYYFIYLQSAQRVELWLRNIAAGQDYDLTLRNAALQVVGHSGELGNANEYIRTGTLPAGWYYIQVYNRSGGGSTQAYHLRVVYPATALTASEDESPALRSSNSPPVP